MNSVEADGSSIDEAIESALKTLGTTRDRVEIEILSNASRGLFGLGGKKARIRATLRRPIDAEPPAAASPHPAPRLDPTTPPPVIAEPLDRAAIEHARQ